jgi:hypothetical protein
MLHTKTSALTAAFLFLALQAGAQLFGGNPARIKWYQINTDTARIIFTSNQAQQAQRIANVIHTLNHSTAKPNHHPQCVCAHGPLSQ